MSEPIPSLTFRGWWEESEKNDTEAWETFRVVLHGEEAGDSADTPEQIQAILSASGYELILRRKQEEP